MAEAWVAGQRHQVGEVIDVTFYPNGPDTEPVYNVKARIVGYDALTERCEFEVVSGGTGRVEKWA